MKNKSILLIIVCIASLEFQSCSYSHSKMISKSEGEDEDIKARSLYEQHMLANPTTKQIPYHIRKKELAFAATLPANSSLGNAMDKNGLTWKSRGPWNVGGRTRAIGIDITNEKVIIAGGVTGGIWRSIDSGTTWKKVSDTMQDINISCIIQNTSRGKNNIWYAGTGENFGSGSGGNSSAYFLGNGILRSIDSGKTWSKLAATSDYHPQSQISDFDFINNLAIDTVHDILYAAMHGEINRSTDDGITWFGQKNTYSYYTDVAVTSTGIVYAYRSCFGSVPGIYRSADGINFTNITPSSFPTYYEAMTMCIDPNNENTLYIMGNTPGQGKYFSNTGDYASFWKYRYVTGDGSGTNGVWTDISNNLPSDNTELGSFNTQYGYNIIVKVKPGDSNTVFLGGTNLYRSTDAFSTSSNTKVIGGYDISTSGVNYQLYPNHHPDQHALVFYPSNPNKMLSGCDGGIFRNDDNTDSIKWTPLNNGFITTQFYSIGINHDSAGDNQVVGGLQDNGSYMSNSNNGQAAWNMVGKSDGCFSYIANNGKDYYVSSQYGQIIRTQLDKNGNPYLWARLDPSSNNRQFVNPFAVDPNNEKRMYFVDGYSILVNDDVTQIPLQSQLPTSVAFLGWSYAGSADTLISALTISPSDRLVYGTGKATLFRMDNASNASTRKITTITGANFPLGAYINSIAISPQNPDEMIVVFSNYDIPSLFYTTDGGTTWTDISGNLEQFSDGSGNGPSCRWGSIMTVQNKPVYLIGTSTGLYSCDSLNGSGTIWIQQDSMGITNNIVTMIDTRNSDGFVAISTYGGGVFSANITALNQVAGIENAHSSISYKSFKIYPDPILKGDALNISIEDEKSETIYLEILNEEGKSVISKRSEKISTGINTIQLQMPSLPKGIYYVSIQNNEEKLSRTLVVQ